MQAEDQASSAIAQPASALPDRQCVDTPDSVLAVKKRRLNQTILRLIVGWMSVLVVLTIVGLLANLEWARPKVEQAMQEAFHRQVKIGGLSWMLGFNGLSIWTDRLVMSEQDGKPFVVAGECEIGVAFIPLLEKRVIIKHVQFHHPEVFATQTSPGKWNFSDLLVEGPEIRYVEVDDGIFHLRNLVDAPQFAKRNPANVFATSLWRSYDLQDVCIKLIFPSKHNTRPWPFYLSFKMPHQENGHNFLSSVSLTLLCNGPFEKWKEHPCKIDLTSSRLSAADWRPFFPVPDGAEGLISINFHGKGTPLNEIHGRLSGTIQGARIISGQAAFQSVSDVSFSNDITISDRTIDWDNLKLKVASVDLASHGSVIDWRTAAPQYSTVVSADLKNLSQLSEAPVFRLFPSDFRQEQSKSSQIELTISGNNETRTISTRLKTEGLPISNLLSGDSQKDQAPLMSLFKIEPDKPISGRITVDGDQTIKLEGVQIPANGSIVTIDGAINAATRSHNVDISSTDLSLDKFDTAQLEEKQASSLLLSGKIDLDAHLFASKNENKVDVHARLKDASLDAGKDVIAYRLNGMVVYDGKSISLQHVAGLVENDDGSHGKITIDGSLQTGKQAACRLAVRGKQVDIADLLRTARLAHLPFSAASVGNLSGTASDIAVNIEGTGKTARCNVRLTPEDMRYRFTSPKGVTLKPLAVTGGSIAITDQSLDLKDLPVTAQTGKLTVSASFTDSGKGLAARTVSVRNMNVSVDELADYLSSPDMPPAARDTVSNVLAPLHIRNAHGKTSGNLDIAMGPNDNSQVNVEGTISVSGVSGKIFDDVPFDHLAGNLVMHADGLQLQDVSLVSGASRLHLAGDVKNIDEAPQWNLQVTGHCRPADLIVLLPSSINKTLDASGTGQLALRAAISGDTREEHIAFHTRAAQSANLHLGGPGWNLCQPQGQPLAMDGTLVFRLSNGSESISLEGAHMNIGDSSIQIGGKVVCQADSDKLNTMELTMSTPQAVAAPVLLAAALPGIDTTGGSGTIKGSLAFAGTGDNLLTHGDFALSGVSLPALNLKNLDGRVHSPRWSLIGNTEHGLQSQLAIQINNATIAGVPIRDLSGTVILDSGSQPCLTLSDGQGSVAGGHITAVGAFHLNDQSWSLDLGMSQLQIDEFVSDLIERSGEVTGLADGHVKVQSKGTTWSDVISNLDGSGHIEIAKGTVPKVAALQEKLNQANLLQQGIFGFNINNVLQTMLPVKAGKFKEVNASFSIADGIVSVDHLNFVGSDLRLRAAGDWNLAKNTLNVDVAGNIPRVASSILPGAVGQVSRNLTIQKAVRVMTFNKLENLPAVPILGDIGTDDPRAFTFKVACDLEKPDAMQQSISRTFRWLPNKPNASAHPIPRLLNISLSL